MKKAALLLFLVVSAVSPRVEAADCAAACTTTNKGCVASCFKKAPCVAACTASLKTCKAGCKK